MNDLVQRLQTEQPIVASLRPETNLENLKAAVDRGYVHIKFTETRGGTELGIRYIPDLSDVTSADWEKGTGSIRLVGDLTLDYVKVRFHGTVDIATMKGTGRLEVREPEPAAAESATAESAG